MIWRVVANREYMPVRYPKVRDISTLMEQMAPAWLAEPWDNVGLLAGKPGGSVKKIWVALESSPQLLSKAKANQVQMLLLHHPPIFKPLKNLITEQPAQAALIKAAAGGLNIFVAHTNLDAAADGVNHALAERLGLLNTSVLQALEAGGLLKLVVFVPIQQADALREALFRAGAGHLGNYEKCSFMVAGQGQFQPRAGALPALGRINKTTKVDEARLEMLLPKHKLGQALATLWAHHPYEEPAFDIVPLLNQPSGLGFGRVGELTKPMAGKEFLRHAAKLLNANSLHYTGELPKQVRRVAVLGGSGAHALPAAAAAGAQVFITGEAGYHSADAARDMGICLATLGHYATEAIVLKPWAAKINKALQGQGFTCLVQPQMEQNPWNSLTF